MKTVRARALTHNESKETTIHNRARVIQVLIPLLILAVIAAGCAKVAGPRGWAQPQLTDNALYVTLSKGKLSAIDSGTYKTIWTFPSTDTFQCGNAEAKKYTIDGIYGAPAVDDNFVYFASYDGAVWAVKRSDGTCAWRVDLGDLILAAPLLGPSGLYVAATDGYLYVLDPATGDQKNKFNSGEAWTTPLLTDDALYVVTMKGQLWKLDPKTLDTVWSAPFKVDAGLLTPPTLVGDNTIIVGGISGLYAVDTKTGQQKWTVSGSNWFWGQPAVSGTTVYVTDLAGEVKALDATDGHSVWAADFVTQNPIRTGAVVATKETLVVVDNSGLVYRIDPNTGTSIGQPVLLNEDVLATPLVVVTGGVTATPTGSPAAPSATPPGQTPVPGGVNVFIVTESGHLFTLDPDTGRTTQVASS
jgi:outer membrane protein assembly factor BamB